MKTILGLLIAVLIAFSVCLVVFPEFHQTIRDFVVPTQSQPWEGEPNAKPVEPETPVVRNVTGIDADVRTRVQTLNASWRLHLIERMGLDKRTFKLAQGTLGNLSADTGAIARAADEVPPNLTVYRPEQTQRFSDGYRQLLQSLHWESDTAVAAVLQDYCASWVTYQAEFIAANRTAAMTQRDLFQKFVVRNLDPSTAADAVRVFKKAAESPLNMARDAMLNPAHYQTVAVDGVRTAALPSYSPTVADATVAVRKGRGVDVAFDPRASEGALTEADVEDAASGCYELFAGRVSGSFDDINRKAAQSSITVRGRIHRFKLIPVARGSWFKGDNGPYRRAYDNKGDAAVWANRGQDGWNAFFGQPDGLLARRVTHLLLVGGYSISVRSDASWSQQEYRRIAEAVRVAWPIGPDPIDGPHEVTFSLDDAGRIEVRITHPESAVEIWGVVVADAPG